MDNLTHSLAGAVLGQMGLKHKTRFGMPALVIAANLPDIDAWSVVLGPAALAMRRGDTHGPIAMVLLPLVLVSLFMAYAHWRPLPQGSTTPPLRAGWLLALCAVGVLSHPLLDWLNSYGVRWLEPFSSQWFAADTLFIIDVWIWVTLAVCVGLSIKRERRGDVRWRSPAWAGAGVVLLYIVANGLISERAESVTKSRVHHELHREPTLVVANPVPLAFWQRHMLWRDSQMYGHGSYSVFGKWGHDSHPPSTDPQAPLNQKPFQFSTLFAYQGKPHPGNTRDGLWLDTHMSAHHGGHPRLREFSANDAGVQSYLFWSRMPIVAIEGDQLTLMDQRFTHPLVAERFTLRSQWPQATTKP